MKIVYNASKFKHVYISKCKQMVYKPKYPESKSPIKFQNQPYLCLRNRDCESIITNIIGIYMYAWWAGSGLGDRGRPWPTPISYQK